MVDVKSLPSISVITPTWNRERFLPHAYQSFLAQIAQPIEWIVIDDSDNRSQFMENLNDQRVIYHHSSRRVSVGEKRNLAIELARGEIIAHFDDDEIYAPDYLSTLVGEMQENDASFAKLSAFFIYSQVYKRFGYWDLMQKSGTHFIWSHEPMSLLELPPEHPQFVDVHLGYGFSYVYTKRLWEAQHFPPLSHGEDQPFALAARDRGERIVMTSDSTGLCLHVQHAHNTSFSFPQYLLPAAVVEQKYPYFTEALNGMVSS